MTTTPAEIAAEQMASFHIRDGDVDETSASYIEGVLAETAEAARVGYVLASSLPTAQEIVEAWEAYDEDDVDGFFAPWGERLRGTT